MPTAADPGPRLHSRLHEIASTLHDGALGVSVFDYLSGGTWQYDGGRWFHAASTIKITILRRRPLRSEAGNRSLLIGATNCWPISSV